MTGERTLRGSWSGEDTPAYLARVLLSVGPKTREELDLRTSKSDPYTDPQVVAVVNLDRAALRIYLRFRDAGHDHDTALDATTWA